MSTLKDYILFNDHHIVVANKPNGVGVNPMRNEEKGFMQWIEAYVKSSLHPVHRIDVPVSGIVLFAKNKKAAAHIGKQFKAKTVDKTYYALTRNSSEEKIGYWEDMILKHRHGNKSSLMKDHDKSKTAKCKYEWVESLDHVHLWRLHPSTGRHHQLRVQMSAHIGPIRGDQKYGDKRGNRDRSIDLHAYKMRFRHPSNQQWMEFKAPTPNKAPWTYFSSLEGNIASQPGLKNTKS